jgi:hypothetical protein
MTATKLFNDLYTLTKTENLSSDSDYSKTLSSFLKLVRTSKMETI